MEGVVQFLYSFKNALHSLRGDAFSLYFFLILIVRETINMFQLASNMHSHNIW